MIIMNENTELLEYIYQVADMGVKSTTNLLKELNGKDNKIKKAIEDELKEYEGFYEITKDLLVKYKVPPKPLGMMADLSSSMGIKMEVLKDNSDAKIADMLTQGLTMGKLEMEKKIKNYQDVIGKDLLELAKGIAKFQENSIKKLQPFL